MNIGSIVAKSPIAMLAVEGEHSPDDSMRQTMGTPNLEDFAVEVCGRRIPHSAKR